MKIRSVLLILCASIALCAQSADVEITAEPAHHNVLENSYVRVFKVEVPPDHSTLMHWHRHDYFFVTLGATEISNEIQGKPVARQKLSDGDTRFTAGGFEHMVRNLATTPFRNVTIELLGNAPGVTPWDEERGLHVLPGGTQHILMVKDGVRVSEFELQPGGMVPEHHHAAPHLAVALTDLEFHNEVRGKGMRPAQMKAGDVAWIDGGITHSLMNAGKSPARWLTFEFPAAAMKR